MRVRLRFERFRSGGFCIIGTTSGRSRQASSTWRWRSAACVPCTTGPSTSGAAWRPTRPDIPRDMVYYQVHDDNRAGHTRRGQSNGHGDVRFATLRPLGGPNAARSHFVTWYAACTLHVAANPEDPNRYFARGHFARSLPYATCCCMARATRCWARDVCAASCMLLSFIIPRHMLELGAQVRTPRGLVPHAGAVPIQHPHAAYNVFRLPLPPLALDRGTVATRCRTLQPV